MSFVLTLVSSEKSLLDAHLARAVALLRDGGNADWLADGKAADISLQQRPSAAQIRELRAAFAADKIDVFINPAQGRKKKLLLSDMDSTIVIGETLDDLALHAGEEIQKQIIETTARAMRGEIDFATTLRDRLKLLKGLTLAAMEETRKAAKLMAGAEIMVKTMRAHGATCVLVTGGFTFFSQHIADWAGFQHHHANVFEMENEALTGELVGDVLDKVAKRTILLEYAAKLSLTAEETMAIGDGSNDLLMLEEAGLGIGYQPKPLLQERLDNCILYGDLTAALYAQGYRESEFTTVLLS